MGNIINLIGLQACDKYYVRMIVGMELFVRGLRFVVCTNSRYLVMNGHDCQIV